MRVSAQDFQSWRAFDVEVEGLTVIVGTSNIGKSAIFRAIRGVCRNEIEAGHIRKGTDETRISMEFEGHTATVTRNSKGTSYNVNGEDFGKLSGETPASMASWGFQPVEVGSAAIDPVFASQFDSPFLLTASPAERNAVFGAFSSTEKLDAGRKEIKAEVSALDVEAKALGAEIERKLTEFGGLKETLEALDPYEEGVVELHGNITGLTAKDGVLGGLIPTVATLTVLHGAIDHLNLPDPAVHKAHYRAVRHLGTLGGTLGGISIARIAQKAINAAGVESLLGGKYGSALTQLGNFKAASLRLARLRTQQAAVASAWESATQSNHLGKALTKLEVVCSTPSLDITALSTDLAAPSAQGRRAEKIKSVLGKLDTLLAIKLPSTSTVTKAHKAVEVGKAEVATLRTKVVAFQKALGALASLAPIQSGLEQACNSLGILEAEVILVRKNIAEQTTACPKCGTLVFAKAHNGC